jgi:hypothetical protein
MTKKEHKAIVYFYYKRDSLPHSEYAVIKSLTKFLEKDTEYPYKISTSTVAIFTIVRAFCLKNNIDLVAEYEDIPLVLDKNMRMQNWSKCPDFNIMDDALENLLAVC